MPKEYREIVFSPSELGEAMRDYFCARNPGQKVENPNALEIQTAPELGLSIRFGKERECTFGAHEITAALIRYANKLKIPISRSARKALATTGSSSLTLKLWIG